MIDRTVIYAGLRDYVSRELLAGDDGDLDEKTPLLQWGVLDSLGIVGLLEFMSQRWKIRVPDADVKPENFQDLHSLTNFVLQLNPQSDSQTG